MTAKEKSELPAGAILRLTKGNQYMCALVLGVDLGGELKINGFVQCRLLPLRAGRDTRGPDTRFFVFPIKGRGAQGWKPYRICLKTNSRSKGRLFCFNVLVSKRRLRPYGDMLRFATKKDGWVFLRPC
jgi:hypothetical protein